MLVRRVLKAAQVGDPRTAVARFLEIYNTHLLNHTRLYDGMADAITEGTNLLLGRGWSVNAARKISLLICAVAVVPVFLAPHIPNVLLTVIIVGIAGSAAELGAIGGCSVRVWICAQEANRDK